MSILNWPGVGSGLALLATGILLPTGIVSVIHGQQENSKVAMQQETSETQDQQHDVAGFHEALLKIAAEYKTWGRVDDETRWAPWLCRAPMPSRVRFSESEDEDSHGQKLYYLFARDRDAYMQVAGNEPAVGQVVVKESWHPVESTRELSGRLWEDAEADPVADPPATKVVDAREPGIHGFTSGGSYYPWASKGDKLYHADRLAELFIMYKTDVATPGTDNGWVYGTVTADGKTVTLAGRVMSCMACHQDAPHDRLFGLK